MTDNKKAMKELKESLKSSFELMSINEGSEDCIYTILYKDGTGIVFSEAETEYQKLIKLNNIIYIELQTGDGHYNSIHGETFEKYSDMTKAEIEEFDIFIENCINVKLSEYGLQYYRIENGQKKYDTIRYINPEGGGMI
jgi:DNA replication protein DnaD